MANVKFPRKEFEKKIPLTEEIIKKISLFGTPLEVINDKEIEIEIFPNRPDLLSIQNYQRAFNSYLGEKTGLKKYKLNPPRKNYNVYISPSVKNIRHFTCCAIVKNIKLNKEKLKSIIDLQEKLHNTIGRNRKKVAIGIYPFNKIKLPIKYTAMPPDKIKFVPLESSREMTAKEILFKHPKGKEYAHLLEDYEKYPVFLDSNNKILSMPPIINSHETGKVDLTTKELFIECSGNDFKILISALNIIITTFAEMNAQIYQMNLFYGKKNRITPDLRTKKASINVNNVNKLLGLELKESDLKKLLQKMEYNYLKGKVEIPSWRTDILHEVDLIEDVAIAFGYDNLKPVIPNISTIGEESKESKLKNIISEILIGLGLLETSSYHLIKQIDVSKTNELIELEDSKSDYKFLRNNLLTPILRILSENKDVDYPQKLFETGTVFLHDEENKSETGIKENENLIVSISPGGFTEIKQILNAVSKSLGIEFTLEDLNKSDLIQGRTASILLNNEIIGYLGEIHPKTLKDWSIFMPVSVIEISLDEIKDKIQY